MKRLLILLIALILLPWTVRGESKDPNVCAIFERFMLDSAIVRCDEANAEQHIFWLYDRGFELKWVRDFGPDSGFHIPLPPADVPPNPTLTVYKSDGTPVTFEWVLDSICTDSFLIYSKGICEKWQYTLNSRLVEPEIDSAEPYSPERHWQLLYVDGFGHIHEYKSKKPGHYLESSTKPDTGRIVEVWEPYDPFEFNYISTLNMYDSIVADENGNITGFYKKVRYRVTNCRDTLIFMFMEHDSGDSLYKKVEICDSVMRKE